MIGADQQRAPEEPSQLPNRAKQVWSEETLRLVFENSPDAILIIDDGLFIDCNRAAVQMFCAPGKEELLSISPSHLSPPAQPDGTSSSAKAREMIAIALERGSHRFEWLAKRQDDSQFPAEILLTAIPIKDKHVLHAVWRDISRRKEAERELSKSRDAMLSQSEVLTSILHHMGDAVIVADRDYRFLTFNPAAERMFGTGATETKAEGWARTYGLYLAEQ